MYFSSARSNTRSANSVRDASPLLDFRDFLTHSTFSRRSRSKFPRASTTSRISLIRTRFLGSTAEATRSRQAKQRKRRTGFIAKEKPREREERGGNSPGPARYAGKRDPRHPARSEFHPDLRRVESKTGLTQSRRDAEPIPAVVEPSAPPRSVRVRLFFCASCAFLRPNRMEDQNLRSLVCLAA